jgi:hypothetical protein
MIYKRVVMKRVVYERSEEGGSIYVVCAAAAAGAHTLEAE